MGLTDSPLHDHPPSKERYPGEGTQEREPRRGNPGEEMWRGRTKEKEPSRGNVERKNQGEGTQEKENQGEGSCLRGREEAEGREGRTQRYDHKRSASQIKPLEVQSE